jgi:hypothetical protein
VGTGVEDRVVLEVLGLYVTENLVPARGREVAHRAHEPLHFVVGDLFQDFKLPGFDQIYKKTTIKIII